MLPNHINIGYIADHINRIETRHAGKPTLIEDSLYRIASNAGLLDGPALTEEEKLEKVLDFIEEFKNSPEGQEAIAYVRQSSPNKSSEAEDDAEHILDIELSELI